jgi:hypothetical protein
MEAVMGEIAIDVRGRDPATLALYPVRTRPLAVGLLATSATGAWPLANLLGLLGVTVGLAHGPLGLLVAVVRVVLQVLFCITLARFVASTILGQHKHPAVVIASAIFGAGFIGFFHANSVGLTGPPFVIEALAPLLIAKVLDREAQACLSGRHREFVGG